MPNPIDMSNEDKRKRGEEGLGYVSIMTSPSHTYGNALAYMENWIINLFEPNYFKTIHVNSKIAHRQLRSTGKEFFKKEPPILIVRPRVNTTEDRFLMNTPLIERRDDIYSTYGFGAYQPFFYDAKNGINIQYQMNRLVMYTDVSIILNTAMEQIDIESYIRNAIRINIPFYLDTYFESYLSEDLLKVLSQLSGIPIVDAYGNTKDFLSYMNGNSSYPITYKLDGASGTKEFYRYYPVRIDTIISDLEMSDGNKHNQVSAGYVINFSVRMEFNSAGMYFLFSNHLQEIKRMVRDKKIGDSVVPVFTDVYYAEDHDTAPGWIYYRTFSVRLGEKNEHVNITQILNQSIIYAIDYHLRNGLPMLDLIDIRIRKQGKQIHAGIDYEIDYKEKAIVFKNDDFGYYTYTVLIYINLEYINSLLQKLLKLE